MKKMVVHQYTSRTVQQWGTTMTITHTLCGRDNKASKDGMNSGDGEEVTCKFCLKIRARRAKAQASS
jgi:hypothetical protein